MGMTTCVQLSMGVCMCRARRAWVWDRSSAASISSRMYRGAGLYDSSDRISERATSDLCGTPNTQIQH
jgi:hypothetical protein